MQIASLFAKAGFQVDTSGLTVFRQEMAKVKTEMTETLKVMGRVNNSLKGVLNRFRTVQGMFDPGKMSNWRQAIGAATRQYVRTIQASQQAMDRLSTDAMASAKKLNTFHGVLRGGVSSITTYTQAIFHLEAALERLRRTNTGQPIPLPRPRLGAGQGQGGGGGSGSSGAGQRSTGLLESLGIGALLRPMLPTGMGLGGMLGAGYATKELIRSGREVQAMEIKLEAVSRSALEFQQNLEYVRKTSQYLAMDTVEFGKAYATIFETAKAKASIDDIQRMNTGFNKFFKALQLTPDEAKGAMRAIGQMFNKGKILAEEFTGQLGERATGVTNLMAKTLGVTTDKLFDMMKKGQLKPDQLYKLADAMGAMADNSESFNKSLNNSLSAQIRFNNAMKDFSRVVMESGLDKALASMFEMLVKSLKIIVPLLKSTAHIIYTAFKALIGVISALFDAISNHPFITITIAAVIAGLAMWAAGFWAVANGAGSVLLVMQALITRIAGFNWVLLRSIFLATTLVFLLSQLNGYASGETNWLSVWQAYLTLLMTKIELFFVYVYGGMMTATFYLEKWIATYLRGLNEISLGLLGINEQQKAMFDMESTFFGKSPEVYNPRAQERAAFNTMLGTMGIGGGGGSVSSTTIAPVVQVTIDAKGMSPQMQEALRNGDMNAFGTSVGTSVGKTISVGGLGQYVGK